MHSERRRPIPEVFVRGIEEIALKHAIKTRVDQIFKGVPTGSPGQQEKGLFKIITSREAERGEIISGVASAYIHDTLIARRQIFNNAFATGPIRVYELFGRFRNSDREAVARVTEFADGASELELIEENEGDIREWIQAAD